MHRLPDVIFSQHRAPAGPAIARPRVGSDPSPLELAIIALALGYLFSQQQGPAIPQHGKISKLVPGIVLGQGYSSRGEAVTSKDFNAFPVLQQVWVQAQLLGQRAVKNN